MSYIRGSHILRPKKYSFRVSDPNPYCYTQKNFVSLGGPYLISGISFTSPKVWRSYWCSKRAVNYLYMLFLLTINIFGTNIKSRHTDKSTIENVWYPSLTIKSNLQNNISLVTDLWYRGRKISCIFTSTKHTPNTGQKVLRSKSINRLTANYELVYYGILWY